MRAATFIITALVGLTVSVSVANAGTFTFLTRAGSTDSAGRPLDAEATITTGADSLSVTLTNLQANPTDVTQTISDLDIAISSGSTAGVTLTSSSGQGITVNSGGTFTPGSTIPTGWGLFDPPSIISLQRLPIAATNLIIGPPGPGSRYSNADGSIAGNSEFNPFLFEQATFMIHDSGVTAASIVGAVDFSFGNVAGLIVSGVPLTTTTPLPATLPLFATGLGALGLLGWRRKRKARVSLLGVA